ncbi:AAA family ATPase [Lysinibacillus fusiformis]|uniref:AAA family ATPase n=1 Tax=Lysinibacillus sp. PWR01 TaxID=3342384 RepID=UPI00372CF07C
MKILYCYIEKYKEIKNQQFNLNSKFKFSLNKSSNEFHINFNQKYIDNFFSDTNEIDLIALVGKNGVGKSSILNLIQHLFFTGFVVRESQNINYNNIFATEENNLIKIYIPNSMLEKLSIYVENKLIDIKESYIRLNEGISIEFIMYDVKSNIGIIENKNNKIIGPKLSKGTTLIYYSNQYDFNWNKKVLNNGIDYKDISLNNRIYEDINLNNNYFNYESHIQNPDNRFVISSSQKYLNNDIRNKMLFLSNLENRKYIEDFLDIPPYIYISLDYMSSQNKRFFLDIEKEKLLRYERDSIQNFSIENLIYSLLDENIEFKDKAKSVFLKRIIDSYFTDIEKFLFFKLSIEKFKEFEGKIVNQGLKLEINKYLIYFSELFCNFIIENNKVGDIEMNKFQERFLKITDTYVNFIEFLITDFFFQDEVSFEKVFVDKNKENTDGVLSLFVAEEAELKIATTIENTPLINNFINEYIKLDTATQSLVFKWGELSTGEENLFTFISEMEKSLEESMNEKVIILIDEGDLTLHPEWQRKYINILIELINKKICDKQIQIIITTHSPLIMSDLPIGNTVMLEKNKYSIGIEVQNTGLENSFAANIHDLYKKGQFLESTTGEFAIKKIEETLQFLNSKDDIDLREYRNLYERALKIIKLIGEPIIQKQLMYLLEEKKNTYLNRKDENINILDYLKQMQESIKNEINILENQNDFN